MKAKWDYRPRFYSRAGLTLLELLVVCAICAVLAGLGFSLTKAVRWQGMRVQSIQNLRVLAQAAVTYAADHGHHVPAADITNLRRWHGARAGFGVPFDPTQGFLADYLGQERRVTRCPLLAQMMKEKGMGASFEDGSGGYGYNSSYLGGMSRFDADADGVYIGAAIAAVLHPSRTVMFSTTAYANGGYVQEYPFCEPPFWDLGNGPSGYRPSPSMHFRFNGQALVAWCDGHVTAESCDPRDVGYNPHGGNATQQKLGWFGPDADNGYWNPAALNSASN